MPGRKRKVASIGAPDKAEAPRLAKRQKAAPEPSPSTSNSILQDVPSQPSKRITRSSALKEKGNTQKATTTARVSALEEGKTTRREKQVKPSKSTKNDIQRSKVATHKSTRAKPTKILHPVEVLSDSDAVVKPTKTEGKRKASEVEEAEEAKPAKRVSTRTTAGTRADRIDDPDSGIDSTPTRSTLRRDRFKIEDSEEERSSKKVAIRKNVAREVEDLFAEAEVALKASKRISKPKVADVEEAEEPVVVKKISTRRVGRENAELPASSDAPAPEKSDNATGKARMNDQPDVLTSNESETAAIPRARVPLASLPIPEPFIAKNPVVESQPLQTIVKEDKGLDELSKRIRAEIAELEKREQEIRGRLGRPGRREEDDKDQDDGQVTAIEQSCMCYLFPNPLQLLTGYRTVANTFVDTVSHETLKQTFLLLAQHPYLKIRVQKDVLEKGEGTQTVSDKAEKNLRDLAWRAAQECTGGVGLGDFGEGLKDQLFWIIQKRKAGHYDTAWTMLQAIASYIAGGYEERNDAFYDIIDYLMLDVCLAQQEAQPYSNPNVGRRRCLSQAVGDPPFDLYGRISTYLEYVEGINTEEANGYEGSWLSTPAEDVLRAFYSQTARKKLKGRKQARRMNRVRPLVHTVHPDPEERLERRHYWYQKSQLKDN